MSFDINILVNGSRCKLYNHRGRTYVEAKEGSEYVIEIKNNSWEKILAVVSVDGLNVVDGKTANENGAGYVLDKYTSQKLYGFQYSSEKVASFKFGAMGAVKLDPVTGKPEIDPDTGKEIPLGYAASKGDGSEKNAGVIGVRIWDEIPQPPPPPIIPETRFAISSSWSSCSYALTASYSIGAVYSPIGAVYSPNPKDWGKYPITGACNVGVATSVTTVSPSLFGATTGNTLKEAITDAKVVRATAMINTTSGQDVFDRYKTETKVENACLLSSVKQNEVPDLASFDMETQWGQAKTYKVKETTFDRKAVIHMLDIYYASRESLVAMGIDLGTERRVSFPESFTGKYAKPPKGWSAQ